MSNKTRSKSKKASSGINSLTNREPIVVLPQHLDTFGPSLPLEAKNEALICYKLHRSRVEKTTAEKKAKETVDSIKNELESVQREMDTVKLAISNLDESTRQENIDPKSMSDACKLKLTFRDQMSDLLYEESRLRRQLCMARITYRNAKLELLVLLEDIQKFRNAILKFPSKSKKKKSKGSKKRKSGSIKSARAVRDQKIIQSVANSITAQVIENNRTIKQIQEARKARENQEAKKARETINPYLKKSMRLVKEKKAVALAEIQKRQHRQVENLNRLNREIAEIRHALSSKNFLKRIQDEELAAEKEEVKNLLVTQGKNPYLADYMLEIEEKQRQIQCKMLMEEKKRLLDMQREYAQIEAQRLKERIDREKWDQVWSERRKLKLEREKKENYKKYFALDSEDEPNNINSNKTTVTDTSQQFL